MKIRKALRLLLLITCCGTAPAQEPLPIPDSLGEFTHAGLPDFEAETPGAGYAHNYSAPNASASIYLYTRLLVVPDTVRYTMVPFDAAVQGPQLQNFLQNLAAFLEAHRDATATEASADIAAAGPRRRSVPQLQANSSPTGRHSIASAAMPSS
jgi:hypothetical protein